MLGDGSGAVSQSIGSITTSGTSANNQVVNGNTASAANSTLTVNATAADTYAGILGGGTCTAANNLSVTKTGAGILTLSGTNGYLGGTNINGGELNFTSTSALGQGNIAFGGGALQYSAINTTDYSTRIANSTGAVSIDTNGQNIVFANSLAPSNSGGIAKSGAGTLTLPVGGSQHGNHHRFRRCS